eukprot:562514-Hanusia_phi.AAC.1
MPVHPHKILTGKILTRSSQDHHKIVTRSSQDHHKIITRSLIMITNDDDDGRGGPALILQRANPSRPDALRQ